MNPCVDIPLEDEVLGDLVEKAKDYALMHGICMRRKDVTYDRDALHHAPFVLFPSPFPRIEFEHAVRIQTDLNELMHKVAHDRPFLEETLASTVKADEFTGRLFGIYKKVWDEGRAQLTSLGLFRSDYFYCGLNENIKQVEFNTIASSFGGLSSLLVPAHKFVLLELGRKDLLDKIPENLALQGLAGAMLEAWTLYNSPKAVILFIVEDVTFNICDQKFHEFEIRKQNADVFVVRKTLTEVATYGKLDDQKRLIVKGKEVAVVYFRSGYSPDQYPSEKEWEARLMIERSKAIKSPSIHYHLAGTKKVQQQLAQEGCLEHFFGTDAEKIKDVRGIFTGLYSIDHVDFSAVSIPDTVLPAYNDTIGTRQKCRYKRGVVITENLHGQKAFNMAVESPEKYVLKPQREGGGNNVYGDKIRTFLKSVENSDERNAYILMDRIQPPKSNNYVVRPGAAATKLQEVISELGIFGCIIGDDKKIISNRQVGHMLRTKLSNVDEGGVAAGLGALDSVFLVDVKAARGCPAKGKEDCKEKDQSSCGKGGSVAANAQ